MKSKLKLPEQRPKSSLFYLVVIALVITSVFFIFGNDEGKADIISINTFIEEVRNKEIKSIEVKKERIDIVLHDDSAQYAYKERGETLRSILVNIPEDIVNLIDTKIISTESEELWTNILIGIVPIGLIILFFMFMMRSAQSSNNQAMSFGKSKARLNDKEKNKTTFKDVAGAKEAKEELVEIVDFLKKPTKYTQMGAKIPKGVMLVGAPGTGKTLLARAVAGEANVPFFNISGSEFVEMFVGVGASRVRDLFKKAKRNAPSIIFIDEIDAVGRQRGAGMGGGHDEREQTLNQILTEMDGFEKDTNIIIMAATNRPDVLDPALLRPGRFDRRITIDMPDIQDREAILQVHSKGKPIAKTVDYLSISRQTAGFSGADLENLLNEAAILAAKENKKSISMHHVQESIEKVALGPARKSLVLTKLERQIVAYHEVGHAIVGHCLPYCDPIHKVTVISRGHALGVTWSVPEEDKRLSTKTKFEQDISSALGGYVAEKLVFGDLTNGASSDLQRVTEIARQMVTRYGMSNLGPMVFGDPNQEVFLGRDFGHVKNYSEEIASKIDIEIKRIIEKAYKVTTDLLTKHHKLLDKIAMELIKKENINGKEFKEYFKDVKLPPKKSFSKYHVKK